MTAHHLSVITSSPGRLAIMALLTAGSLNAAGGEPLQPSSWKITSSSGEIAVTETSRHRTRTWTFSPDIESGANWIRVNPPGELEYRIAFEGVEGSSHPGGYTHGGTGSAEGGEVFGGSIREDDLGGEGSHRTESRITGTYSETHMSFDWTVTTVISAGHITTEITGGGSIEAERIIADIFPPGWGN